MVYNSILIYSLVMVKNDDWLSQIKMIRISYYINNILMPLLHISMQLKLGFLTLNGNLLVHV